MLNGFLFKNKKNGINHITIGIDDCKSLCGSATYNSRSSNPDMKKIGERMPLDDLIVKYSKYCNRCLLAAEKQIESELAYQRDAEEALRDKKNHNKKQLFF